MLYRLHRLLLLGLLTGSCAPPIGELPNRITLNEKVYLQHTLLVPDDTTDQQLENLLYALSKRSPALKAKYGLEGDLDVVYIYRERDRAGANKETRDEMSLGNVALAQRRSYYHKIAVRYSRAVEGTEIGTIGHYSVEHKVIILRGPAAQEEYQLLKKSQIPAE